MGYISFDKEGRLLDKAGNPVHIVGINYVASYICTNFWEDWRPEIIAKDLENISKLGLQAVRIPMMWGYMEPEERAYNDSFFAKFDAFIEMCRKYELYIMPWFLVGVATKDYDIPYRQGRPFFSGDMVTLAENHLKHFIAPYKDEEQILFWDICDEPEFYSRNIGAEPLPYKRNDVARWVRTMYQAIKSVDQNHLVTLGFGHIATENYGMDIRDMADILDLMVVTCYPGWATETLDKCRQNYTIPYHVKMNTRNKPVFTCEAPGNSSIVYSEEIIGKYFQVSLYSNLINGSTGVLPWVYNDFDQNLWHTVPLEGYLSEPYFGIVTVDGRLKPSGEVLRDYAAFAKKAELGKYRPHKAKVAVLVPEGYYQDKNNAVPKIYSAFIQAKGCSVNVDLVWTSEDLSGYQVLIMPTVSGMIASQWDKIRKFVENGGTLYQIYDNVGCLSVYFNDLFGVTVQGIERDHGNNKLVMKTDWGKWHTGDVISVSGTDRREWLSVKAMAAEVLCSLEDGSPALLKNHYGKGVAYLATIQMNNGLMEIPYEEFVGARSFCIMETIMQDVGVDRLVRIESSTVEVGCLEECETGNMLVVCVNHDKDPVAVKLSLDRDLLPENAKVVDFDSGEVVDGAETEVYFEPAGVHVYKISK